VGGIYPYLARRFASNPPVAYPTPDSEVARFRAEVAKLTKEGSPIKLHFGCAHTLLRGFINIDVVDGEPSASVLQPTEYFVFPFADRSLEIENSTVDYIFSEDFIEHISQLQQIQFLAEALRVLKPGSINRVSMPNLITSIRP
jgi:predicted SAM-dependent methyltransferase